MARTQNMQIETRIEVVTRRCRRFAILGGVIGLLAVVGGCEHSATGIFAEIEVERRIDDERDLPNTLVVNGVTELGNYYYLSAFTIRRRLTSSTAGESPSQWAEVAGPPDGGRNVSLVRLGDETTGSLIGAFISSDGSSYSLARKTGPDAAWETINPPTAGKYSLFSASSDTSTVFLNVAAGPNENKLYFSTSGSSFDPVIDSSTTDVLTSSSPFVDAALYGSTWYIASRSTFVLGAVLTGVTDVAGLPAGVEDFSGLFSGGPAANEKLYLGTIGGLIAAYDGTWSVAEESLDVPITDFAYIRGDEGFTAIIAGTDGDGYREINPDTLSASLPSREGNYQSSELASAAVLSFYVDSTDPDLPDTVGASVDLLFAGTSGLGLWKNYQEGAASVWTRE